MKQINNKKQKGFSILAVILVIVAVIVAIGVWALSGQTNTSSSGNSTSDIQASSLINDSSAIKLAYDNLIINGSSYSSIIFKPNTASTPSAPNVLDPVNGVQLPKPNANAIKVGATTPFGMWIYDKDAFLGANLGDPIVVDPAVLVAGVKDIVCQRVNYILHGSTDIPALGASTMATFLDVTITNPNTTDTIVLANSDISNWTSGCFATENEDENVFFRVLKVN